ncbi:MAG: SIMPL domain-containing protein [Patescibacteria group bacterium]
MPKLETSKSFFWAAINVLLVILAIGLLAGAKALYRYSSSLSPARVITVSAEGKTVVIPDIATVSFSVISEGASPAAIQTENTVKINQALDFVKSQGIDSQDIKTTQYSLSPKYIYDEKKKTSHISGYELRQSVQLKIRDFTKISSILGKLPELGVNEIGTLQFELDDPDDALSMAREEAFLKARTKAELMADQNGVRVKRVVNFYETPIYYPFSLRGIKEGGFGGDLGGPLPTPTIEPGSQELTVNVSVTYEIK